MLSSYNTDVLLRRDQNIELYIVYRDKAKKENSIYTVYKESRLYIPSQAWLYVTVQIIDICLHVLWKKAVAWSV